MTMPASPTTIDTSTVTAQSHCHQPRVTMETRCE